MKNYRAKTKGQNRFGTFSHFLTLFPPGLFIKIKPFLKRKERKRTKKTKPFCTLVVARSSSSKQNWSFRRSNLVIAFLSLGVVLQTQAWWNLKKENPPKSGGCFGKSRIFSGFYCDFQVCLSQNLRGDPHICVYIYICFLHTYTYIHTYRSAYTQNRQGSEPELETRTAGTGLSLVGDRRRSRNHRPHFFGI